jgi:hypothetical protein
LCVLASEPLRSRYQDAADRTGITGLTGEGAAFFQRHILLEESRKLTSIIRFWESAKLPAAGTNPTTHLDDGVQRRDAAPHLAELVWGAKFRSEIVRKLDTFSLR